jgi:hypothetical protein
MKMNVLNRSTTASLETVSEILEDIPNHNRNVRVIRIDKSGEYVRLNMPSSELLKHFDVEPGAYHRTLASVFRDFRIFANHQKYNTDNEVSFEHNKESGTTKGVAYPR